VINRIPKIFRNFYTIAGFIFLIWMLFIDSNNFISQIRLSNKLKSLEREKAFYTEKIKEVEKDRNELFSDNEMLEKFAREKYLMKKKSEDIYIIVEK